MIDSRIPWLLSHLSMCCFFLTYLPDYFVIHGYKLYSSSLSKAQSNHVHAQYLIGLWVLALSLVVLRLGKSPTPLLSLALTLLMKQKVWWWLLRKPQGMISHQTASSISHTALQPYYSLSMFFYFFNTFQSDERPVSLELFPYISIQIIMCTC